MRISDWSSDVCSSDLKVEDIAWNWRNGVGDMAPLLIEASNLVDVLVLNTALPSGSGPDMRWIISSVVTESGKPVLAVPPATKKLAIGRASCRARVCQYV